MSEFTMLTKEAIEQEASKRGYVFTPKGPGHYHLFGADGEILNVWLAKKGVKAYGGWMQGSVIVQSLSHLFKLYPKAEVVKASPTATEAPWESRESDLSEVTNEQLLAELLRRMADKRP